MAVFSFDVYSEITDEEDFVDRLYEAGGDDASVAVRRDGRLGEVHFDRDARSLAEAIASALAAVQLAGGRPVRVGPQELVWASEIAARIGRTREYVRLLIAGQRGPGGWPVPVAPTARNPLWRWSDVVAWFAAWPGSEVTVPTGDGDEAVTIEAVNGALDVVNAISRSLHPQQTRRIATELLDRAS